MKLTKSQLKQIIKEELENVLNEESINPVTIARDDPAVAQMRAGLRANWPEKLPPLEQAKAIVGLVNKVTGGNEEEKTKLYRAEGGAGLTHFDYLETLVDPSSPASIVSMNDVPRLVGHIKDFVFKGKTY